MILEEAKKLIGAKVSYKVSDDFTITGNLYFVGVNNLHGMMQVTINRFPYWPADLNKLKPYTNED